MYQSDAFAVDGIYLDTASIGVPPRVTIDALHAELDRWARGAARPADFDSYVQRARNTYAALLGVPASWLSSTSVTPAIGTEQSLKGRLAVFGTLRSDS